MKSLLIMIISLVLTPTAYASEEKYHYYCPGADFPCEHIRKGDLLTLIDASDAVLYCDEEKLILDAGLSGTRKNKYTCIYNGKPIQESKHSVLRK